MVIPQQMREFGRFNETIWDWMNSEHNFGQIIYIHLYRLDLLREV